MREDILKSLLISSGRVGGRGCSQNRKRGLIWISAVSQHPLLQILKYRAIITVKRKNRGLQRHYVPAEVRDQINITIRQNSPTRRLQPNAYLSYTPRRNKLESGGTYAGSRGYTAESRWRTSGV